MTLGKLAAHLLAVDTHWAEVAKSQRGFTDDITASYTESDAVRTALEDAQETTHSVHRDITCVKPAEHPTKVEAARLLEYKKEVDDLLKERPEVVKAFTEAQRYDVKTDKLVAKTTKANEKKLQEAEVKATRNQEKKVAARAEYKTVCDDVTGRMRKTYARHTDVLSAAHDSFWHIQAGASGVVNAHSQAAEAAAIAVMPPRPPFVAS